MKKAAFEALVPNVFWLKRPREIGEAIMRGTAMVVAGRGGGRVLKNNPKHTVLITSKNWLAMQKLENLLKYPINSPALQFSAQMFH